MRTIVVFDIGKTNAKLCVIDADSGALVLTRTTQTPSIDRSPYLQIDTATIWNWYLDQLRDLANKPDVSHIVVTAHGATAALITDHDLALPVMDYEFEGPDTLADEYNTLCDPFESTYSPRLPHGLNVGRQLHWQQKKCATEYTQARHLLPYPQFWSWKLTGIASAEVTTIGSHTDLWNPIKKVYSEFAIQHGYARLFPPLSKADDVLGPVLPEIQQRTGLSDQCKVLVGIHDSNASLIPWLKSRARPFTVMSTGTWVIIFALGTPLDSLDEQRDCTANVNLFSEPIACARFMGGREFEKIIDGNMHPAEIADLHRIVDEKIVALPAFADSGGPFPGCKGSINSSRQLTAAERYALASVYCALTSDESLNLCGSSGDIIVEGAFAKNRLLMQCLAVFRNSSQSMQKILASTDTTGTTMGAAMLASDTITAPDLQQITPFDQALSSKLTHYRDYWHQQIRLMSQKAMPAAEVL